MFVVVSVRHHPFLSKLQPLGEVEKRRGFFHHVGDIEVGAEKVQTSLLSLRQQDLIGRAY